MEKKGRVISNLIWRFAERCGAQGVQFIVSLVLARVLEPSAYGTIALVTVFTTILQVFVDSGMGNALIQKKNADEIDFSTVFYFNIAICLMLYLVMFVASPYIAKFYNDDSLTDVIRVLSLTIVISGVKNVQQAYVSRNMMFKRFFFATLGGTIASAILGIVMAYNGFGVWALVAQQILNTAAATVILWITVKWCPKIVFSLKRLKGLFSYGWKLLVSSLIDTVYNNIRQLIIGKLYSAEDLSFYNRGKQFPNFIVTNVNTSIDSVLLPAMSREQDDVNRVKNMTRRSIKISTYVMAPLMMGLAFMATNVVKLILTDKWLECVPFLQIFCITYMFYPIHTANLNAIRAMGRSDLFLKLEVIKKIIGMIVLVATMWFGVMAMAYSLLFTSIVSQIVNAWPNKKLLNYGYKDQLKDILPSILLAVFMGIVVYLVGFIKLPLIITMILQVLVGIVIYILISILFKFEAFDYILEIMKSMINKFRKKEV